MRASVLLMLLVVGTARAQTPDAAAPTPEASVTAPAPVEAPAAVDAPAVPAPEETDPAKKKTAASSAAPVVDPAPAAPAPTAAPVTQPAPEAAPVAPPAPAAPAVDAAATASDGKAGDKAPAADPKAANAEAPKIASAAALLGPPSGLQLTVSWSLFSGVQTDDDLTNAYTSLQVSTNYKLHPKIFFAAALTPYVELTRMPGDNRRFDFQSSFLRLNFRNLYEIPYTGIRVGGAVTYQLPVAYSDLFSGNKRFGGLVGAVQMFRSVGDATLIANFSASMPLFANDRPLVQCDPAAEAKVGATCPPWTHTGSRNTRATLSAGLTALYNIDKVSVFASMGLSQGIVRGPAALAEAYQGVAGDFDQIDRRYSFSFVAQVSYSLTDHLSPNIGLFNGGPQRTDRTSFNNFLFDPKFAGVFVGLDWVK